MSATIAISPVSAAIVQCRVAAASVLWRRALASRPSTSALLRHRPPLCNRSCSCSGPKVADRDHCLHLVFSKSSASNNLVRRICAHARPKIPFNLNSGAWKTGPNLPHRLIGQRDERGSPFSSLLGKICLFAKQSATYKGRELLASS